MAEYMLQVAAKLEISCEESAIWEMSDICNVVKESLTHLHTDNIKEPQNLFLHQILHFIEMIKQYPPTIQKERVTSYFHRNGMRYWFYVGTIDDKGRAQKYDAVSLYYPGGDLSGSLDLDHVIKVPEGEFKVMGVAKFSPLINVLHKIKKLTMPEDIKSMIATRSITDSMTKSNEAKRNKPKQPKKTHQIIKKPIGKKKQSGVSSFLKYIAPGAGSLLLAGQYTGRDQDLTTSGEEEGNDDNTLHHASGGHNGSEV